ncbi:hypothetical protein [Prosthecomicrobium sp. N25]|uniref:hypothetical protein n=1 Tax=Prosthecomicrobium sp. N25 TaxID=3129254 RepID=UPI00307726DA
MRKSGLVLGALLFALPITMASGASAQGAAADPRVQAEKSRTRVAIRYVAGQCRSELGPRAEDASVLRTCIKERTKPYRKACKRDAKAQGLTKLTDEFRVFAKSCVTAQLIAAYRIPVGSDTVVVEPRHQGGPERPLAGPPRPGEPQPAIGAGGRQAPADEDDDDYFFDLEN